MLAAIAVQWNLGNDQDLDQIDPMSYHISLCNLLLCHFQETIIVSGKPQQDHPSSHACTISHFNAHLVSRQTWGQKHGSWCGVREWFLD